MLHYDLGVKPNDWEERLNSMSASTRKKREKAKFLGIFKRYTKKDAEGTRSYFAPTDLLYSLLPNITEDDGDMKNKKASTVPPVKATNTNKNNIDTNSIPQKDKKDTKKENKKNTGKGASANVNNTFEKYDPKELENMLEEGQKGKFYKGREEDEKQNYIDGNVVNVDNCITDNNIETLHLKQIRPCITKGLDISKYKCGRIAAVEVLYKQNDNINYSSDVYIMGKILLILALKALKK